MMPRTTRLLVAGALVSAFACDHGPKPTSTPADAPSAGGPAPSAAHGDGAEVEFSGWEGWVKANGERKQSQDHSGAFVDVYIEQEYAEIYAAGGAAPVGMRVVKAQYEAVDSASPNALTVMAKRDGGYDPDNGDWYYGMFAPDGTTANKQGKLAMCSGCHAQASDRDFLFGMQ